jgi:hypothetical protein
MYGIVRALHLQIHLEEIDQTVRDLLAPPVPGTTTPSVPSPIKVGQAPLVLNTFLEYLTKNGHNQYEQWLNSCSLRYMFNPC